MIPHRVETAARLALATDVIIAVERNRPYTVAPPAAANTDAAEDPRTRPHAADAVRGVGCIDKSFAISKCCLYEGFGWGAVARQH